MEWEQPQPIKLKPKNSTLSFGQLVRVMKTHCQCLSELKAQRWNTMKEVTLQWREEQFRQAIYK